MAKVATTQIKENLWYIILLYFPMDIQFLCKVPRIVHHRTSSSNPLNDSFGSDTKQTFSRQGVKFVYSLKFRNYLIPSHVPIGRSAVFRSKSTEVTSNYKLLRLCYSKGRLLAIVLDMSESFMYRFIMHTAACAERNKPMHCLCLLRV